MSAFLVLYVGACVTQQILQEFWGQNKPYTSKYAWCPVKRKIHVAVLRIITRCHNTGQEFSLP